MMKFKSRNILIEYYTTPIRQFAKKYKMSLIKTRRTFGFSKGKTKLTKDQYIEAIIRHGLNPDEIGELIQEGYALSEIMEGKWKKEGEKVIFVPKDLFFIYEYANKKKNQTGLSKNNQESS